MCSEKLFTWRIDESITLQSVNKVHHEIDKNFFAVGN